jgi:gliding motility-associated-like protein
MYKIKLKILFFFFIIFSFICNANKTFSAIASNGYVLSKIDKPKKTLNAMPILKATGNQIYCPQTSIPIVTDFSITDSDDTFGDAIYIQISSGYNKNQDLLTLTGLHPTVVTTWNPELGKLKISAPINGILTPYTELIAAVKDVMYTNSSKKPTGNRSFSISSEPMSYLPSNQHFYEYIKAPGITWGDARIAADAKQYFGMKGYLATLLNTEEQQLVGEQLEGNGWIGGSDFQKEGEWRWITGPEADTLFWSNLEVGPDGVRRPNIFGQGFTPNFMYWNRKNGNNNEPDNGAGFENFAHIIDRNAELGILGSWTDLTYEGTTIGPMKSRGYIVEYGGSVGDPILTFVTTVSLTIPQITETKGAAQCGSGVMTLEAKTNVGEVTWYDSEFGGTILGQGTQYTTNVLNVSKTYYVSTVVSGCISPLRTAVEATIYPIPVITTTQTTFSTCGPGETTLTVTTSAGETYWYDSPTSNQVKGIGTSFSRIVTSNTTFYVEAVLNSCTNGIRIPIHVIVYDLPPITNEEMPLCRATKNLLDGGFDNSTYSWSTGETTKTILVNAPGEYTVTITLPAPQSCTLVKTIKITDHPDAIIKSIVTDDKATTTITLTNPNSYYEYSLNGTVYQESNRFTAVSGGIQTIYIREKGSCNPPVQKDFIVVNFPKFFTPNGDGFNDILKIPGLENYPSATLSIFDRMGKLIKTMDQNNLSWDGTYNEIQLPSTDYWYVLRLDDSGVEKRGHFSLKR